MDQTTHAIRKASWLDIIQQCQQRPADLTIKQWCRDNDIHEKSYYYWQRKLHKEAAEQMAVPTATPAQASVSFTEVPFNYTASSYEKSEERSILTVQPTAVFKCSHLTIAVTNDISDHLLSRIIQEVSHA